MSRPGSSESGAPRPGALRRGKVSRPGKVYRPLRLTRRGRIVAAVTLVLFILGVLWIGGRIETAMAGERAAGQASSPIAAHVGATAPWQAAKAPTGHRRGA